MKLFFAFGTRPEAIKMAPIIHQAQAQGLEIVIALSGQHKEMIEPFIEFFQLKVDENLELMKPNQSLKDITVNALSGYNDLIAKHKPDIVLVQGDTTTSFTAALAAFYQNCPVAHIEAGLRTYNLRSPFPEEANRRLISQVAQYHFPPTKMSQQNLAREGITENVVVTGNTSIDALEYTLGRINSTPKLLETIKNKLEDVDFSKRIILVTTHRRENLGSGHREIFTALKELSSAYSDIEIVFPVHLNPNVRAQVQDILGDCPRVKLIEPLDYLSFVWLTGQCYLILTDSGGVQEEAPHLGKPVIVLRDTTERPEAVEAGCSFLVGTSKDKILEYSKRFLEDAEFYQEVSKVQNPFGDGRAAQRIVEALL